MIDKKRIKIRKYQPEDMIHLLGGTDEIVANARLNQVSGPGFTVYLDNELAGCGGVRIAGVGEAWSVFSPETMKYMWDLFDQSRALLEKIIRNESLWRLWAETKVKDRNHELFLKRLNFQKREAFVR